MTRLETGVRRPAPVTIRVDGAEIEAFPGETLAAALLAAGRRAFRRTPAGEPRGPFCLMGVCFECVVESDGQRVRACVTPVRAGMEVRTGGAG
jgi:predicted molibdopterin-dependent oxidoreductase YjgC